jgi:hypothetical protein
MANPAPKEIPVISIRADFQAKSSKLSDNYRAICGIGRVIDY